MHVVSSRIVASEVSDVRGQEVGDCTHEVVPAPVLNIVDPLHDLVHRRLAVFALHTFRTVCD
jgi:hypothetical protein